MRKTNTLEELDNTSISSSSTWRREGFRRAGIGGGASGWVERAGDLRDGETAVRVGNREGEEMRVAVVRD